MKINKDVFNKKISKWLKEQKWQDISDRIEPILFKYKLEEIPYKPKYLVIKDNIPFFLNFFWKGDWSHAKKLDFKGTGIDLYKFHFLDNIQGITHIQVGLVMYSEEQDKFVFRQLDQLPKPIPFFLGNMCYAYELKKKDIQYKCFKCWQTNPSVTRECLTRSKHKLQGEKKRLREMAMWKIDEFADTFTIQPKFI